MRWLIYGINGWIGGQIKDILVNMGEIVIGGVVRADNYDDTKKEILNVNPNRIICSLGRTSGCECQNIDYLEQPGKLPENIRDNLQAPLNLAILAQELKIHMMYIGTGCLYSYDENHVDGGYGFTDEDKPNFTGSQYSTVKGFTDQLIRHFDHVLNCRIRMPISDQIHPRNFITKISKYKKIISIPNSMTVLPELLPIMIDMAKNEKCGSYNMTNPGSISHQQILDMYKTYVDPSFTYQIMSEEELSKYTVAKRSNNFLDTTKISQLYTITPIYEAVKNVLIKMGNNYKHK